MTNRELLNEIINEATELRDRFANVGGRKELAFDLTADEDDLNKCFTLLHDHGTRIRDELNPE